jgi:hypothetical protein
MGPLFGDMYSSYTSEGDAIVMYVTYVTFVTVMCAYLDSVRYNSHVAINVAAKLYLYCVSLC